ncbi:MAG: sodium/solute symporter [Myxococcales bacterium]|nr:sodium/solute symporter [Myxococcales bacterium]
MGALSSFDGVVIAGYFLLVFAIAFLGARGETKKTSTNYFLAGRNVAWWIAGASLFASNIGSEHLVGLAGTGAASGLAVGHFELLASLILLVLGWVFVPLYLRSGVFTMPEFLERRYSPAARWYLAVVSIVAYVLTKISVTIYAGGVVFESLMGVGFWVGATIVVIATGVYTVFGGLKAVLYTDTVQAAVLLLGAALVTWLGFREVGGWDEVRTLVAPEFFEMWKPATHPEFPWTGILFGAPILGIWYWCTDQFIVQRVLSARDVEEARRATVFAGFLKLLPLFLFVGPGILAVALSAQGKLSLAASDQALPTLIVTLLPSGVRGLVCAGLLAALMSTLSSVFNSCSTVVTWDLYKKWRPDADEKHLVRVGQGATALLVLLGLAWIPFMKLVSGQLYTYLQSVQAYISPPIAAVFLLGVLYRRLNAAGAVAALWSGLVLGATRLLLELNRSHLAPGWLLRLAEMNFLHFAVLLFVATSAILVGVSLLTAPPRAEATALCLRPAPEVTSAAPVEASRFRPTASFWASCALVLAVLTIWWLF